MRNVNQTITLWLDNHQGLYNEVTDMARRAINNNSLDDVLDNKDQAVNDLATYLKDFIYEMVPVDMGIFSDIISHALADVDWQEMATEYIEDNM